MNRENVITFIQAVITTVAIWGLLILVFTAGTVGAE